jgi:hypothetical protein
MTQFSIPSPFNTYSVFSSATPSAAGYGGYAWLNFSVISDINSYTSAPWSSLVQSDLISFGKEVFTNVSIALRTGAHFSLLSFM